MLHLLAHAGVPEEIQKTLFEAGTKGVKDFSAMFADEADLRGVLKKDFKLDPDEGGLKARVSISKVVIAWETAKGRTAKLTELEGEAEQRSEAKRLPTPDHKAMKTAFESKHWEINERATPAPRFMEKRFDMIEKNDLRAEPLSEVLGADQEDDSLAVPRVAKDGSFTTVKVGSRIPLPENTETLRTRLDLWGRSWIFASTMHTNRAVLGGLEPMDFTHYVNNLLGEHVMGLVTDGPEGTPVVGEMWLKILDYDLEMRKEIMRRMEKGTTMKAALKAVPADSEVKMKYFTDPVQFKLKRKKTETPAAGGGAEEPGVEWKKWRPNPKGKGKGKFQKGKFQKGKGKGKNKNNCKFRDNNGKPICFAFNNQGEWCPGSCGRSHVCGVCFKPNKPMFLCDHKKAEGEPSG